MAVATYNEMIKGLHTFTYDIDHYVDSRNNQNERENQDSKSEEKEKEQDSSICKNCGNIIEVINKLIKENPNDYDLGEKVRLLWFIPENGWNVQKNTK